MQFTELGLSAELIRAIAEQGYTEPTPVQTQAIPPGLAGQDVLAGAQTGTGKTAAFALPILQRLQPVASTSVSPAKHPVRALILTPTRELAAQVWESFKEYGKHIPLRTTVVYGGVSIDPQIKDLRAGVEILVATPGRLLDHVHQRTVNLGQVQILVLDEADRMLDMGFMPDIKRIISLLPVQRQNMMFSATFPEDIKRLAEQILQDPARIQVARQNTVTELVTHSAYKVDTLRKRELLERLIRTQNIRQVLVFTSTKLSANRLARALERDGFVCAALHSDKTQGERTQALSDFKEGKLQVLVATDIAARGLDIDDLPHVINYELPPNAEDYIHRIGRTGRAGQPGDAISLVSYEEQESLSSIERLIKTKIPFLPVPSAEPRARAAAAQPVSASQPASAPARERPAVEGTCGALLAAEQTTTARHAPRTPVATGPRRKEVAALFRPPAAAPKAE
jgi:ATP-dependent RNA helicase RhlE